MDCRRCSAVDECGIGRELRGIDKQYDQLQRQRFDGWVREKRMNIYVHRFNNAIRALQESEAPHKFGMDKYGHGRRRRSPLLRDRNPCGTPSCVLGHYGFRTDLQSIFRLKNGEFVTRSSGKCLWYSGRMVARHFGITRREAFLLFFQNGCGGAKTPAQAIKYIRAFIAQKWPAPNWNEMAMQPLPQAERVA